jgi:uncharacterized protein (TIGR02001 family)
MLMVQRDRVFATLIGGAAALFAASSEAADFDGDPVLALEAAESIFDVAFGVTFTSEYISRGVSQGDGLAVQPWAELDIGMFYLGYWGSNVDGGWENDLSVGIRPEFGDLALDFGYVRYIYSYGDCCGELYAIAEYGGFDPLTVGALVYYDPDSTATYVEGNAAYGLPHGLSVSGAVGVQTDGSDSSATSWNAGLTWDPYEFLSIDARYHGGPDLSRFVVSLSLSNALSTLGILKPN